MQQPQHMMQFDLGCMDAHDLTANASEVWPILLGAHAAAVHNNSGFGELTRRNERLPMTLDTSFLESDGDRLEERAIIHLGISGKRQSLGKSFSKGGFHFTNVFAVDGSDTSLRVS
jgi:hypothetical protein